MFAPVSDLKQGTSGILSITNFKLSFITTDDASGEVRAGGTIGGGDVCVTAALLAGQRTPAESSLRVHGHVLDEHRRHLYNGGG